MVTKAKLLQAAKTILAAEKKPTRTKNPAPRLGTAKPKRKSQATGKAPSKRLVKRRQANTKQGYFPNPSEINHAHQHDDAGVLPFIVTTETGRTVAGFGSKEQAVMWAKSHAKRENITLKIFCR